ncbi:unnamed protein product [Paramecium octaurelia]|uniref:Uncharacterized protein n=1 Tax=Paramecium octaurelia TaxID=43137 RepID=A0A8S1YN86_PAROT|nr:unnamed protein product [Paramecium octaurelia]
MRYHFKFGREIQSCTNRFQGRYQKDFFAHRIINVEKQGIAKYMVRESSGWIKRLIQNYDQAAIFLSPTN